MSLRTLVICLSILALAPPAAAQQVRRRGAVARPAPAEQPETLAPRRQHPGLVYVLQTIDLSQQIRTEDGIMTLDGEPPPPLQTRNVTLGVVIDESGHIITRLTLATPGEVPQGVIVRRESGNKLIPAKFIGVDAVTGLCLLHAADDSLRPATFAPAEALPARQNIRLAGFNPRQGQSRTAGMTLFPRINEYPGRVAKAVRDFRYTAANPIYRLLAPQLTAVQDGSLALSEDGSLFGIAVYDAGDRGLVYPISRVSSLARAVLKANTSITHGWLGARGADMYASIRPGPNPAPSPSDLGVRVTAVIPDSPAAQAGVRPQDILLSVNERAVASVAQLTSTLKQLPADSEVTLKVKRGGEYKLLRARLTPAPGLETGQQIRALARQLETWEADLSALAPSDLHRRELEPKVVTMRTIMDGVLRPAPAEVKLRIIYGLDVQPLTAQLAQHFAVSGGVLVTTAVEAGKGARAGLRAGDVIVKVGGREVADPDALLKLIEEDKSGAVELTVSRRRAELKLSYAR